jgi:hypothetical protein
MTDYKEEEIQSLFNIRMKNINKERRYKEMKLKKWLKLRQKEAITNIRKNS